MKNNKFLEQTWGMPEDDNAEQFALFERLSAYFDGEATPEECRAIQELLDTNEAIKRQYLHLHQLRQGLQAMPVPASESPHRLEKRVLARLDRSRAKVVSLWGGGAIAALFIAGVMAQMPRTNQPEIAQHQPVPTTVPTAVTPTPTNGEEPLIVALNRPVLQIPKLATATDTP